MPNKWPDMEYRGPQVTEFDVVTFERRLGHTLPDDYRRFLLDVNGGRTDRQCCEFSQGVLNGLHGLHDPEEGNDLEDSNRWAADLPSRDLLYVGYDDGGGRILVGLVGEHRGEVWYQDMVDPRPVGSNPRVLWHDRRDVEKIANSFEEFMRSLGPLVP